MPVTDFPAPGDDKQPSLARTYGVRLYLMTCANPHPELTIESLDFVSTMTGSAPFLVAMTVEP